MISNSLPSSVWKRRLAASVLGGVLTLHLGCSVTPYRHSPPLTYNVTVNSLRDDSLRSDRRNFIVVSGMEAVAGSEKTGLAPQQAYRGRGESGEVIEQS